jgi:hypothetical protein
MRIVLITEAMNHAKQPPLCVVFYTTGLPSQAQPSAVDSRDGRKIIESGDVKIS